MSIRSFEGVTPEIADSAYIDPDAVLIGDVTVGNDSSFWPCAVARGDVHSITIGERTSVQDGSVLHVTHDGPYSPGGAALTIGDDVTIGHKALLHACAVGNRVLIGMGAIVMDRAVIEDDVLLGAGALVTAGKRLESGWLYRGNPVEQVRRLTDAEIEWLKYSAAHYVRVKNRY